MNPLHLTRRTSLAAALGALALSTMSIGAVADERPTPAEASAFVQTLADRAIGVLNDPGTTPSVRVTAFDALLSEGFEFDVISRFVVGRYWNTASEPQKADYKTLFRTFVLKKYSTLLGAYSDQRFAVTRAVEVGDRDVVVSTEISQASQQPVRADWRVRRYGNALKIIDIKVEGISMLTSQREEFTAVIQRNGFDGLLNLLRQQTEASASPGLPSSLASAS